MLYVCIILAVAALVTSMLSAILGMGGGILLLAVIFCFLDHSEAIPAHAAVQLASNGTRILVFIRNIDWRTLVRYCSGLIPGIVLGSVLLWKLGEPGRSEPYLKMIVGGYILAATYLPKPQKHRSTMTWWDFPVMGFVCGAAALTIGAVGPLMAPLFARRDFVKERLIATKAICQLITHFSKIPAFLLIRELNIAGLGTLTLVMIAMVIPGTLLGKRALKHVSVEHFKIAYKAALTLAGLKVLLVDGLWKVMSA